MDEKDYVIEIDLTLYKLKCELCERCINYYQCRGPSVFDVECPKNFKFKIYGEN